ncbi:MAG: NAD(P)-binding domain-containing protein [Elusimicrobiota bacterium]
MSKKTCVVIGAGPIGIETALRAVHKGWDTTVLEQGQVGNHLRQWGHVHLFSPMKDNVSSFALNFLTEKPDPESYLSGQQFVDQVLLPLSQHELLKGKIRENSKVISVAKRRLLKSQLPGHPIRQERPFRLLINNNGREEYLDADLVFDASGVFGQPLWTGESGIPARGEKFYSSHIVRHLPDMLGKDKKKWLGKKILLVGGGHSAATAVYWALKLNKENPQTELYWVVSHDRSRPCEEAPNDPLPERKKIVEEANNAAQNPPAGWKVYRKQAFTQMEKLTDGFEVTVSGTQGDSKIRVDHILSMVGYKPDLEMVSELQCMNSFVTNGAAGLSKALMDIKDCLSPVVVKPEQLQSGEHGFYFIGHKSYGRLNKFLLRSGLQQLDLIFS